MGSTDAGGRGGGAALDCGGTAEEDEAGAVRFGGGDGGESVTAAGAGRVVVGVPVALQGPISGSRIQPWLRPSHGNHNWEESVYRTEMTDPRGKKKKWRRELWWSCSRKWERNPRPSDGSQQIGPNRTSTGFVSVLYCGVGPELDFSGWGASKRPRLVAKSNPHWHLRCLWHNRTPSSPSTSRLFPDCKNFILYHHTE